MGTSIALRATQLGWTVGIYEPNPEHRRVALERLAGGDAFAAGTLAELAGRVTTLVLAAPPDATIAQLGELARALPETVELVVDVASVKEPVAAAGRGVRGFVPTHPIAGSERNGPAAADASLFADRVWSFDPAIPPASRARAERFVVAMGARPVAIASAEHDRVVALTSHLPQVVAVALASQLGAALVADDAVFDFCGTGIRSMLRLAGSSWVVWSAILRANAVPVAQEVRRLADILSGVAEALESAAPDAIERRFSEAAAVAARFTANADANVASPVDVTSSQQHESEFGRKGGL